MKITIDRYEYEVAENRGEWHIFREDLNDRIWGQQYEDGPFDSRVQAEQQLRRIVLDGREGGSVTAEVPF